MATATATKKSRKNAKAGGNRAAKEAESTNAASADQLLKADHRNVEKLFSQYEQATEASQKQELAKSICMELMVHSELEESYFYPACREKNVESSSLDEAQVEHDVAKVLIAEIMTLPAESAGYDAKIKVLSEYVKHHVGEEENSSSGIIAKARKAGVDMKALGEILVAQKQELMAKAQAGDLPLPTPRSLEVGTNSLKSKLQENQAMAQRGNQDRERDDQGRFMSEDDDRRYSRGGGGGGYGRGWDDQDRGGGRGRSSSGQDRDEYGRFMSEDERGGQRSGRGSYDDDDNRGGRGRSSQQQERDEYGRFHSDDDSDRGGRGRFSSQRDRDEYGRFESNDDDYRGGGRSPQQRDRDERGRFASDDDDDRGGRGRASQQRDRDEYGRFTSDDDRGGQRSSGRGRDDDDDRGGRTSRGGGEDDRGWFGDPRGHAEAARRGWEHREDHNESRSSRGGNDDNRRGGNDDNRRGGGDQRRSGGGDSRRSSSGGGGDNRRSSSGEDHGGWFGDSRGHAEAARRGWQHRNDR